MPLECLLLLELPNINFKDELCKKVVGDLNAFAALCRNCSRYSCK